MSKPRLLPLIEYKLPAEERFVVVDEKRQRQWLTVEQFNQQFGVSLCHGIYYDSHYEEVVEALKEKCSKDVYLTISQNIKLKNFFDQPQNYFSLLYVNKICGYTLVANQDMSAEMAVAVYSSFLAIENRNEKTELSREDRAYDMGLGFGSIKIGNAAYNLTLRAKDHGDLTRFAMHLPNLDEVANMKAYGLLDISINPKDVLTANIDFPIAYYHGAPVRYYETREPIKAGMVAGIHYGAAYWRNRPNPCLLVREKGSDYDLRVAYYCKKTRRYVLSEDLISTRQLEPVEVSASSSVSPGLNRLSLFARPPIPPASVLAENKAKLIVRQELAASPKALGCCFNFLFHSRRRLEKPPEQINVSNKPGPG